MKYLECLTAGYAGLVSQPSKVPYSRRLVIDIHLDAACNKQERIKIVYD